jgi:hypothetical protein
MPCAGNTDALAAAESAVKDKNGAEYLAMRWMR